MAKEERGRPAVIILAVIVGLMPFLYFLSFGPAIWLVSHGIISSKAFEIVYAPLEMLVDNSSWFAAAVQWYASWFEG